MNMAARKARGAKAPSRRGAVARKTRETDVDVSLSLEGGQVRAETGIPFFDHMLDQLGRHGGLSLSVKAAGDLHVDAHHTVEDVGIAIGEALRQATADKAGLARYGHAVVPLDEALVEAVVDLARTSPGTPSSRRASASSAPTTWTSPRTSSRRW
jgi:imidazoleglycerol-phosphate dehydratase